MQRYIAAAECPRYSVRIKQNLPFPFDKEYLVESAPHLPTAYRHRQPFEGIVKRKVPDGKEQKAPNQKGKSSC
jgi:hypothetical protein